ncbi:hypothetical protein JCM10003_1828 [Bacteroides pyogenes JCM 10003]|nr:hypothetical protein JCM10003_1828 [Bacteroides pyogenes JCM 10003]
MMAMHDRCGGYIYILHGRYICFRMFVFGFACAAVACRSSDPFFAFMPIFLSRFFSLFFFFLYIAGVIK